MKVTKSILFITLIYLGWSFVSFSQGVCNDPSYKKGEFDISEKNICLPNLVNLTNKSDGKNVKYVFDYRGENLSEALSNAISNTSHLYPDMDKPEIYTILQIEDKNDEKIIACKTVNVRSNNLPVYSYSVCNNLVQFNIPIHPLNNFDTYKFELGNGLGTIEIDRSKLPYTIEKNTSLPLAFRVTGFYSDANKNCNTNLTALNIPSPSIFTNLPFVPNIDRLQLLSLNKVKLDYSGPFPNDSTLFATLYRFEKNNPVTSLTVVNENIIPGSYELSIPDSSKSYCFFVKKKAICQNIPEESAEICTHPIIKAGFNPTIFQNEIFWDKYPSTFKGLKLVSFPLAILNGISFNSSQIIKIDINSSNSLKLNISENSNGYFHKSIDCKNKYCYTVEQTISGTLNFIQYHGVSVSNKLCVNQRDVKVPPIKSLLVSTEDNRNRVYFEDDSGWPLKKERWFLYKNEGVKSNIIDSVTNYQEFLKDTTLVKKSESYKIGYIDQCNSNSFLSDSVSSIYLKFSSPNKIFWTENSPFSNSGVNVYKIFHVDEQTNLPVLNKEILNSKYETDLDLSSFEDYVKLLIKSEAVVGGNTLVSNSNLLEVPIAPSIYIPNVFTPNKDLKNDIFSIYTSNKSFLEFKMLIYNRNGEIVATLNSPAEIWDGTYKSNHVPQGTYIYKITATQKNGEKFFKLGSLDLIR